MQVRKQEDICGGEEALGEEVVRLQYAIEVVQVDAHGNAHEHVLRPLGDLAVQLQQVGLLQRLEAGVVEFEVPVVQYGAVQYVPVGHHHLIYVLRHEGRRLARLRMRVVAKGLHYLREALFGLLVQIGNLDARGEDGIVGMLHELGGEGYAEVGGDERHATFPTYRRDTSNS